MLHLSEKAVGIIDLSVRRVSPAEAQRQVRHWREMLYAVRHSPLSLRIDSTLRGPIGALVQEVLAGEPEAGVIFAPAFPESGRTTLDGRHFLDGQPIMQTEIAHDPWGPVQTDDLRQLLHSHLDEDVALLPLPLIRLGAVAIATVLDRLPGRVVTVDAEINADLAAIAEAMCLVKQRQWIPVDAGPLSAMWAFENLCPPRS